MSRSQLMSRVLLLIGGCFLCMSSFTYANETNSTIRLPGFNITSVCALGNSIFAGTEKHGVCYSWDKGQSFSKSKSYTKEGGQLQSNHVNDVTASAANGYLQLNVATDKGLDLMLAWDQFKKWTHPSKFLEHSMTSACSISKNDYRYNISYALFSPNSNDGSGSALDRRQNILANWKLVFANANCVSVTSVPNAYYLTVGIGNTVFCSRITATSQTSFSHSFDEAVSSVAVSPTPLCVAAGTNNGVLTTADFGTTWIHSLKGEKINKVSVTPNGQILAATDNGLYFSSGYPTFGTNWDPVYTVENGLADNKINAACASGDYSTLFAATSKGLSLGKILGQSGISDFVVVTPSIQITALASSSHFIYAGINRPAYNSGFIYGYAYDGKTHWLDRVASAGVKGNIQSLYASNGYLFAGCDGGKGTVYVYKIHSDGGLGKPHIYNLLSSNSAIHSLCISNKYLFAGYGDRDGTNAGVIVCKFDPGQGTLEKVAKSDDFSGNPFIQLNVVSNGSFDYVYARRRFDEPKFLEPDAIVVIVYKVNKNTGEIIGNKPIHKYAFPDDIISGMTATNGYLYFACSPESGSIDRVRSIKCTFDAPWGNKVNSAVGDCQVLNASNGFLFAVVGSRNFLHPTRQIAVCYKCNSDGTIKKITGYNLNGTDLYTTASSLSSDGVLYTGYNNGNVGACRFRSLDFSGENSKKLAKVGKL